MKQLYSFLLAIVVMAFGFSAKAQNPSVDIQFGEVGTTSFTVTMTPNADCESYKFMSSAVGEAEQWLPMMGGSLASYIEFCGIAATSDTTYTWTGFNAATDYVVYVLAKAGNQQVVCTDTIRTLTQGTADPSVIDIQVLDITTTSAHTIFTPNEATAFFKDMLITVDAYNSIGTDSVVTYLKNDDYTYYETDDWTWMDLTPGTAIYACAIGQNAAGEWGELSKLQFTTLGGNAIAEVENVAGMKVYPNPSNGIANVRWNKGFEGRMNLVDMSGKVVSTVAINGEMDSYRFENLTTGSYVVLLQGKGTASSMKLIVK